MNFLITVQMDIATVGYCKNCVLNITIQKNEGIDVHVRIQSTFQIRDMNSKDLWFFYFDFLFQLFSKCWQFSVINLLFSKQWKSIIYIYCNLRLQFNLLNNVNINILLLVNVLFRVMLLKWFFEALLLNVKAMHCNFQVFFSFIK